LTRTPWRGLGLAASGLAVLGLAQAGVLNWGSRHLGDAGLQLWAVLTSNGLGAAALLWLALDRRLQRVPVWASLALAFVLRALCTQAAPLLEDDHFRYLWDGLRTATLLDPYRLPPAAFFGDASLPQPWQDILCGINNPHLPSIYGPLLQCVFAVAYWLTPGQLAGLQWLLVCADMAVLGLLAHQVLHRTGRHRCHNINPRWLLAYALHPLLLREGIGSAHPDILVGLLLLCSVLAWQAQRAVLTGLFWGLALSCKVSALVALPLLLMAPAAAYAWPWCYRVGLAAAATVVLLYLPFVWVGGSDLASLRVFGSSWRFNPLMYRWLEAVLPVAMLRAGAALLVLLCVTGVLLWWRRGGQTQNGRAAWPPLDLALMALLVWSPVVNPWYWLWALPLAILRGNLAVMAVAAAAAVSYINSTASTNAFLVPWPLALFQMATLLAGLVLSGLFLRSGTLQMPSAIAANGTKHKPGER
jgi:hypothetical protein